MKQFWRRKGGEVFDELTGFVPPRLIAILCARFQARSQHASWPLRRDLGFDMGMLVRHLLWRGFSLRSQQHTFEIGWLDGLRVIAFPGAEIFKLLFVFGEYERDEFRLLSGFLVPGMTVVDVGANIGLYSLFAASRVRGGGGVVAFEPSSREYQRLEANVRLNGFRNIRTYRLGLSDGDHVLDLVIADDIHSGQNTFGSFAHEGVSKKSVERVLTRRLDDVVQDLRLRRVDLIKIDVEGHELAVLRGALETIRTFRPLLLVELSDASLIPQGSSVNDIRRLLGGWGYGLQGLSGRDVLSASGELTRLNALAVPADKEQYAKELVRSIRVS